MSTALPVDTDLHLPDLRIKGFRGINDLHISRLGRVTLLAGKNGTGKTTVLEAVKVYAARGRSTALADLLNGHEEVLVVYDDEHEQGTITANWRTLFYGRTFGSDAQITIGSMNGDQVGICAMMGPGERELPSNDSQFSEDAMLIQVYFRSKLTQQIPALPSAQRGLQGYLYDDLYLPTVTQCELLGPGLPNNRELARYWDGIALTDEESQAVAAINLIYSNRVERVTLVGDNAGPLMGFGRRPVAKLRDEPRPVPLKSLGDGAVRLFGVALALANSKDGFLLIDEAENGIHHSIQRDFWTMILKAAHQNNVQVLATTHSWDCVAGFTMAATEVEEVDGALVRLDRYDDHIRAVEYTEDDLRVAAEQGIEVR